GPRRRQGRVTNVVLEVEIGIDDPKRATGLQRRWCQLLPIAGDEVKPAADVVQELLERGRRSLENQHATDVHVRGRALLVQEGRVDRGQPVQVVLGQGREDYANAAPGLGAD